MSIEQIVDGRKAMFRKAYKAGRGHVYNYGLDVIKLDQKRFYAEGKHKHKPCMQGFEPNPYLYQYDMEVHLFINYNSIVEREIHLVNQAIKAAKANDEDCEQLFIKLDFLEAHGTGLKRQEHFWNACEIRWPTKIEPSGKEVGYFIREPWGEDFIDGLCQEEYVMTFGGSGQGKTHRALAFMCVLWDHYIDSEIGGRCRLSTVSEAKLKSTWAYMRRIYKHSSKGISLYCGRGIEFGEYTIARPHDKKGGGNICGILIPVGAGQRAVDKITGSHGHPVGIYHIDEAQSTPSAPFEASPNFLQNCGMGWISASGNYDQDSDPLGANVIPIGGWDKVDENTHVYKGINSLGIKCHCIHYNNDLSPAYTGDGKKRWGHILPTEDKKIARYPNEVSRKTNAYRRLWIGWRETNQDSTAVFNKVTLKECGCMQMDPNWKAGYPVNHFWAFDSAPTSTDRNILLHFADGVDATTNRWKLHFYKAVGLPKVQDVTEYIKKTADEILRYTRLWQVKPGDGILDWTNITGLPERLKDLGFMPKWMVYNQAPPDGVRQDPRTKRIHKAVMLDSVSQPTKYAHTECENMISMGAMLAQNFMLYRQITGLHEGFINETNSDRTFDEEICLRKFITVNNKKYGELQKLEPKNTKGENKGFSKMYGFSPDILDCIFEACAFAAMYRGMVPGYLNGSGDGYLGHDANAVESVIKESISIYDDDAINIFSSDIEIDFEPMDGGFYDDELERMLA